VDGVVGQGVVGLAKALQLTDAAQGVRRGQEGAGNRIALELRAQAPEDGLWPGFQTDDETTLGHEAAILSGQDSSSAGGDNRLGVGAELAQDGVLQRSEVLFAVVAEDGRDGLAGRLDDGVVAVDGLPAQALGYQAGHLALASAREAGEDDAFGSLHDL